MKIAIIGAGSVGMSLGSGWMKAGHSITYGVREPQGTKARQLKVSHPGAEVTSNEEAATASDIIVLCTPWQTTEAAIQACGNLEGRTIIDATNPLKPDFSGLDRGYTTSGAEQVADWAKGAQVFKAMNQVGYAMMDNPKLAKGQKPVMFVAGDGNGKGKVLALVADLNFEAIDAGGITCARLLEPYALLWIHLALNQKLGVEFAFGILCK
jgi:predicted dinucleotide-binding enzyme